MYEHRHQNLLSRSEFLRRIASHFGLMLIVILFSLGLGMWGYHFLAGLGWVDSFLNASMILGGEGPIDRLENSAAKIFASIYALYSGLILLVSVGILFAPIAHRILHTLHFGGKDQ